VPDPGETGSDGLGAVWVGELTERAGKVPGWAAGPDLVHLTLLFGLEQQQPQWIVLCPAGGEGLPDGERRKAVPVLERIDCPACRQIAPDAVEQVDGVTAALVRRRHKAGVEVRAFLAWLRDEKQIVLADYAGGVTLKAYPSTSDVGLVEEWLADRPLDE
jgi:hypothetical protein